MLLTSTVDAKQLILNKQLEVNPLATYNDHKDFIAKVNGRYKNLDWYYITIPKSTTDTVVDLTTLRYISYQDANELLKHSEEVNTKDLKKLRFYYYGEEIDAMFVMDLTYKTTSDREYRLDTVTVYDECYLNTDFKHVFRTNLDKNKNDNEYIKALKFHIRKYKLVKEIYYIEGE